MVARKSSDFFDWGQGTAVVLQQMPLRLVEIANGVADWVDPHPQTLTLNPRPYP
jgi:hypothetical protein